MIIKNEKKTEQNIILNLYMVGNLKNVVPVMDPDIMTIMVHQNVVLAMEQGKPGANQYLLKNKLILKTSGH